MICPTCKGGKTLLKKVQGKGCYEVVLGLCDRCNGTGEIKATNFQRIKESPEALAELIADAMFLYSTNRHIYADEAVKMASKKEGININLDCVYKNIVNWLKEESETE